MDYELHVRQWLAAAELLPEGAPNGETVLRFGEGSDDDRIVLRIGIADFSWVGSFQRGLTDFTTVQWMPDDGSLLVVSAGAAYVVDARSHALVRDVGRDIANVVCDEAFSLLLLDHAGTTLEAFGPEGRMWSTGSIASGGFRGFEVADGVMRFEACQADGVWGEVGIDVATGDMVPN
jgi:hypothetical protein